MKTASIIIPTFNRANLLVRAVESGINQTYPCEIIVCDHGSTDDTPDVVACYKDRVQYIRREEDRGPIVCLREGIEKATGEIVHINYDDDWMEPMFMEKTIAMLNDDVGFVYSNVIVRDLNGGKDKAVFIHPPNIGRMKDITKYLLLSPLTISPSCAIFRKEDAFKNLLPEVPNAKGKYGRNSGVGEDLLLFLLTSLDYPKYAHVAEPLARFLSHPGSITTKAHLTGNRQNLVDAYTNAKMYYFSLPGSIPPLTRLQSLFFSIKWGYRAGTPVKTIRRLIKRGHL